MNPPMRLLSGTLVTWLLTVGIVAVQATEIWEIQGRGTRSPLEGQIVTTSDNVVTAVGDGLFFIQTPDVRADGDTWTSDGVVVVTSGPPEVEVGDRVEVTGTVREQYGQTEIAGSPTVIVRSHSDPLPTEVIFDALTPQSFQPWPETELERFEGMLVRVRSGVISAPSDDYGEACAATGGRRLMREPGILFPGLGGLPVWDGNPEGIVIDPYGLGGDGRELYAGSRFACVGVVAFAFGWYQVWPTELTVDQAQAPDQTHRPAVEWGAVVASQNMLRFGVPGAEVDYEVRLEKLSRQIREVLGGPDVVAVQEVFELDDLRDLADRVENDDPTLSYSSYLVEGNDLAGIDVGFLVRDTTVVNAIEPIGGDVRFSWDNSLLFDRPPLVLEAELPGFPVTTAITLMVVHLRSLGGIDDPDDGERVRTKRREQSEWLAQWVQDRQTADPAEPLLMLGDFNAFEFSDGYVDVVGQVTGRPDPRGALLPASLIVDPPMTSWVFRMPVEDRYSYVFECSAQALDHVLSNAAATSLVRSVVYARGNADAPTSLESDPSTASRSSDHDGIVVVLGPPLRRGADLRVHPDANEKGAPRFR